MNLAANREALDAPLTENRLQHEIVRDLRTLGLTVVAIPNGGHRRKREAAQMKNRGVVAGFPDLMVLRPGARVDFLELKTIDGKLSLPQITVRTTLRALGFRVHVVRSRDEAIGIFI